MATLEISRLGDPVLRAEGRVLAAEEIRTPGIQRLIDDMVETMRAADGVGLAAPQVGRSLRLAVLESLEDPERPDAPPYPLSVLINPEILARTGEEVVGWEGCLSIEEIRGLVPRSPQITVRALDRAGRELVFEARGYRARVVQHEVDHLEGTLFIDRMTDLRSLTFLREFHRHWAPGDES